MRLLDDNSVSWRVARDLRAIGFDAVHVSSLGMGEADDPSIFALAVRERRVLLTQDSDFSAIHASSAEAVGVILLRLGDGRPGSQSLVLRNNLESVRNALERGSHVTIEEDVIRIRDAETDGSNDHHQPAV
jgi:predicted nuclease of predicted toxin-antitoxin system